MDRRRASLGRRPSGGMHLALLDAVRRGRFRQAQLLVEAGADVDAADATGETPLLACVVRLPEQQPGGSRSRLLRLLLDAGADPNVVDRHQGRCALMHAAILGQTDTVTSLLDHPGVDLELQDLAGNTALMHAARHGHADIVASLLRQMGRLRQILHLSQRNHAGRTAIELAQQHGHLRVAAALGCCCAAPASSNTSGMRPTFPRPPLAHDDGAAHPDDNRFPNPRMLERGPTPGSPLLSFPARWQQRKLLEQNRTDADGSEDDYEDDDFRLASPLPAKRATVVESKPATLPRLKRHESDNFLIDLSSSYGSCRSDTNSSGYGSCWNGSTGSDVPLPGPDRFRRVLNLLDAAIQEDCHAEDEKCEVGGPVPARWTAGSVPVVVGTGVGRSGVAPLTSVRRSSNYFPPVRPIRGAGLGLLLPVQDRANRPIPPIGRTSSSNASDSSALDGSKLSS